MDTSLEPPVSVAEQGHHGLSSTVEVPMCSSEEPQDDHKHSNMALSLTWSYGFDKDLVGGVQSLGEGGYERKSIFFVSGTTGVIFTHDGEDNKTQTLLQGHVNAITGVVISTDKKRIVTADKGKDSLLVVWDSETATPVKTIYRPHPTGVQAVDITPDSRFIVSLSAPIPHELIVEADHGQNPGEHESSHNSRKGEQGEKAENKKCKTAYGSEGEVTEQSAPEASASTARSSHPSSLESSERTGRSTLSSWNGHSGLDASDGKRAAQDQPQSLNACSQGKGDQGKRQTYQSVAVWDWRELGNTPVCVAVIATPDLQHSVLFNNTDAQEILTNGKRRVFFWFWEETSDYFHFYSPALQAKDFKQKIGDFTRSIFMPNSTKAATGTVDGDVVLWDLSLIVDGLSRPDERRAVRILNLSRAAVTFLSVHDDNWIVAGFADGIIGFYDFQFRILRWFDDFNAGPINSISFDRIPNQGRPTSPVSGHNAARPSKTDDKMGGVQGAAAGGRSQGKKLLRPQQDKERTPPFIFSTANASIVQVTPRSSHGDGAVWRNQSQQKTIFQGVDSAPRGMATHPNLPLIGVCGFSGYLKLWNYQTHCLVLNHWFEKLAPNVIAFSSDGKLMGIGFGNGQVKIYCFKEELLRELCRSNEDVIDNQAFPIRKEAAEEEKQDKVPDSIKNKGDEQTLTEGPGETSPGRNPEGHVMVELMSSKESREAVTHMCFSEDCCHLAVAQADRCICLYKLGYRMGDTTLPLEWIFSGKHRSHWRRVVGLTFCGSAPTEKSAHFTKADSFNFTAFPPALSGIACSPSMSLCQPPSGFTSARSSTAAPPPRLFSVGEDRRLVEYDVQNSTEFTGLIISAATVIEQQAVPKGCLAIQPGEGSTDVHVLVHNSDFKMKIWSANSHSCIRTTLAPTHGGVLNSVADVSYRHKRVRKQHDCGNEGEDDAQAPGDEETEQHFLVFACAERLIGMIQKPLDGNPYKAISMVAHPKEIPAVALERLKTKTSKEFLFTCGGTDFTICQWKLNPSVLMANVQRSGDGTQPFNQLIPGGAEGEFYRNMKDYFYYCQIRSEGERTTKSRKLDGTVPLTELANLLCAVGECPSHMDIQNLIAECESRPVENRPAPSLELHRAAGDPKRRVSFEEFLQLYVNHRAVISAGYEEVVSALRVLQKKNHNSPLTPEFLMQTLSKVGEKMHESEFESCIQTLCGTTSLADFLKSPVIDEDAFARKVLLLEPLNELCDDCHAGEES